MNTERHFQMNIYLKLVKHFEKKTPLKVVDASVKKLPKPDVRQTAEISHEVAEKPALKKEKKPTSQWAMREGKEWRQKIIGKAQKTGTPGHDIRSYREAIMAAKRDDVGMVFLNRGYNLATGLRIKSNRRPDVLIQTRDGKIHPIEVPSRTDDWDNLEERNKEALDKLPLHMQGKYKLKKIRKGK
jgi:hypothetical protein